MYDDVVDPIELPAGHAVGDVTPRAQSAHWHQVVAATKSRDGYYFVRCKLVKGKLRTIYQNKYIFCNNKPI